jgi:hypothetical protein
MDKEDISWKLIDKYFKDNPNNLVSHHLESYNSFINKGVGQIFRENNPIRFIEREDESTASNKRNECLLYLGGKEGTKIYFRIGQLISRYNLSDPVDYFPPAEPIQLPDPSVAPPVIKSLKYIKGGNPPTVYKFATIEVSGSCSEAGKSLQLYWNLVSENSPTWTLVKKDILCDLQYFKVQSPAFPGLQFKVREYPSLNYSQPFKLPNGKLK